MRKRFIGIICSIALASALLLGCGTMTTIPQTTAEQTAKTNNDSEIYMFISSPEYADAINELIAAYKEVEPDVTINYETTQGDYRQLLVTKIESGQIPDIFASMSGMEIDTYLDYSYDLSNEKMAKVMSDSIKDTMVSEKENGGIYGFALKGNWFGCVYNKDIFEKVGIEYPQTFSELEVACKKISDAGYIPFTTGFGEWWVFKHIGQHFVSAAAEEAGISSAELIRRFQSGEAKIADYPEMYQLFDFIDLAVQYGDKRVLETTLSDEERAFANNDVAMMLGQGAWVEADCMEMNPHLNIGFDGYPVSDNPEYTKPVSGSDQALRVYKDSKNLKEVLKFVNWWYTSDYGRQWFTDVAGVVPPIDTDSQSEYVIINTAQEEAGKKGTADIAISYDTDSMHEKFGKELQDYIAGNATREETCAAMEETWKQIDGFK